jgi:plastocyanin
VAIQGMQFEPQSLTARRGDTIVWVNRDLVPHTVTAAPAFDSGAIAPNQKWSYVAREAGQFDYGCSFHPTMKGSLLVE